MSCPTQVATLKQRALLEDINSKYRWFSLGKAILANSSSQESTQHTSTTQNIDFCGQTLVCESEKVDDKSENIIDSFLEKNISRITISENISEIEEIVFEEESWELIEEVAIFMVMQGEKTKAIEIYKKLIGDYPAKKSYFLSEIKKLEK